MPSDNGLLDLVLQHTSSEETVQPNLMAASPDRAAMFADEGRKLIQLIDSGQDPEEQMHRVMKAAYCTAGTCINLLGFYNSDSASRLLLHTMLWSRDKHPRHLAEIRVAVQDWMKLLMMRDDDTEPHFIIEDILGERAPEAMVSVTGVKLQTAKSWLKQPYVSRRHRATLAGLADILQESKFFYLAHFSEEELVEWWYTENSDWNGETPLQRWYFQPHEVQTYIRRFSKSKKRPDWL